MRIDSKAWHKTGCFLVAAGIAAGAFGAHALKTVIDASSFGAYQTGVLYHLINSIGVVLLSLSPISAQALNRSAGCLTAGVVLFSGSLYAIAILGQPTLGLITPMGGVLFIAGWILAAVAVRRQA